MSPSWRVQGGSRIDLAVPRRQGHTQRRVIAFTLLAPVRGVLLFLAKAVYGPSQRFGFDAFFAPQRTPLLIFHARGVEQPQLLAQCFTQAIEKRSIVLQLHRVGG